MQMQMWYISVDNCNYSYQMCLPKLYYLVFQIGKTMATFHDAECKDVLEGHMHLQSHCAFVGGSIKLLKAVHSFYLLVAQLLHTKLHLRVFKVMNILR